MKDPSRMVPYTYAADRKNLKSYAIEMYDKKFSKKMKKKHLAKTVLLKLEGESIDQEGVIPPAPETKTINNVSF